jgi:DNA-binding CsgD family transcriptional regulator
MSRPVPCGTIVSIVDGRHEVRPLLVIEGDDAVAEATIASWRASGACVVEGWSAPAPPGPIVRMGIVATPGDAAAALLAAIDGAGVIIVARAGPGVIDRLLDDLRRLGPVEVRTAMPAPEPTIPSEGRAILGLLAEGHSLGEAAAILALPRRTADRRLAEVRRALGVERTTEAVARATRMGLLPPPPTEH